MSLKPKTIESIPDETARVAQAAFPDGTTYMKMRDELGTIYSDEQFADLYPQRGQPALAPWRLALITVMQFAENLTDRQAADAVRARIDWKYALSLELTDAGFNFSVLSEFRSANLPTGNHRWRVRPRLLNGSAEELLLNRMLALFLERNLLKPRGKQRTDSTHVLSAVRNLNRLEIVGETLHHALNVLACVEPTWLQSQINDDWFIRYGQRFSDYRLPKQKQDRTQLAETIGRDGHHLLDPIYNESSLSPKRTIEAIEILRQVWIQHYYYDEQGQCRWRDQKNFPPSSIMIASPYDLEVRYSQKRSTEWRGYKVHLTETCETDSPNFITNVHTTLATDQDVTQVEAIHQNLANKALLPNQHLADGAYLSADLLVDSQKNYEVSLLGPVREENSWQARDEHAFDLSKFSIDWKTETMTCPTGQKSRYWKPAKGPRGKPTIQVHFDKSDCAICPVRSQCTRSRNGPREVTLHPYAQHQALHTARQRQKTLEWKQTYALRSGVEGTVSQAAFALDMRRTRYRGLAKTHLQHVATAAAINLQRFVSSILQTPRSQTRVSHFATLAA
jgi:transposase